ncbi:MAG TPA: Ig-like domain-containing protein [Humisphaera sp.]
MSEFTADNLEDADDAPAVPHRPEYGTGDRAARRWYARRGWVATFAALVLVAAAAVVAGRWAEGKGYKTAVLRALFPNDPRYMGKPQILSASPGDLETGVMPDAFVRAEFTKPNGNGIDPATLDGAVRLLKGNAREVVEAQVNTDAVGSVIVLRPAKPLEFNAVYTFEVLPALKDTGGAAFERFTATFSTAAGNVYSDYPAAGVKVEQPRTAGNWYTGVTFGPDGRLYASTIAGEVCRFDVAADGSLSAPQKFMTILGRERGPRLMTGITFDPASTPDNPVVYVAHSFFPFDKLPDPDDHVKNKAGTPHGQGHPNVPDWSGKITRLSGPNLEHAQDLITGLPRARADHATGQLVFGPDGAMYFGQASNSATGAPDPEWGHRPERLLSAAVLRLDLKALAAKPLPLDVRTAEGGTYDPFAPAAPLTIYATGTRNCYDLLFHSNGRLYASLNGSARGGNTPASVAGGPRRLDTNAPYDGPAVPGLLKVGTQNDYLLRVEPGGYYGHPNPTRGEYVLNGGNPTASPDPCEVPEYPVGTRPDRNWRLPAFDFNKNLAPCGLTEYRGDAFPALKGKVLVVRFSGGKDVIALTPDEATGDVREFVTGIDGFTNFHDPLDLCVSPATGYIYVAEHTGRKITLVRPAAEQLSRRVIRGDVTPPGTPPAVKPAAPQLPVVRSTTGE